MATLTLYRTIVAQEDDTEPCEAWLGSLSGEAVVPDGIEEQIFSYVSEAPKPGQKFWDFTVLFVSPDIETVELEGK